MKKFSITFFFLFIFAANLFSQELKKEYREFIEEFIAAVRKNDTAKISAFISYPLHREYPLPEIKNRSDFAKRFNEVFDDSLRNMIINSNVNEDWSEVGWRGIMLKNGILWMDIDGKLKSIHYQSPFETERRKELIALEKNALHESIKVFYEPVLILETLKFTIRIDDMGDEIYRYSSWSIKSKMSEKPDLIINNGNVVFSGTGRNHHYDFINGKYKYECSVIRIGTSDSPPAQLRVYKNNKVILSENAVFLME